MEVESIKRGVEIVFVMTAAIALLAGSRRSRTLLREERLPRRISGVCGFDGADL